MLGGLDFHTIAAHVRRALATVGVSLGDVDATSLAINGGAVWSTGDCKVTIKTAADAGWVLFNDGTIGDASSGATTRANSDTLALFTLLWTNTADADCAVSSGRGASAAEDFAAHKTIALPKALGRALAVAGAGSGLTSRALASALGSEATETHAHAKGTLASDSGGSHTHNVGYGGAVGGAVNAAWGPSDSIVGFFPTNNGTGEGAHVHTISGSTADFGTGAAGNMQPSAFFNVMVKL